MKTGKMKGTIQKTLERKVSQKKPVNKMMKDEVKKNPCYTGRYGTHRNAFKYRRMVLRGNSCGDTGKVVSY